MQKKILKTAIMSQRDISTFFVAGINYKKTDAAQRSEYAVGNDQYDALLQNARSQGISELFVVSTCNRTEIYGIADDARCLAELLCGQTSGNLEIFLNISYNFNGRRAIEHLFDVAGGLDSQILGDYEIVGQIKNAVKFARDRGFVGQFMDRLVSAVLQSSKKIKTQTQLSSGTVSVSFAAVQFIRSQFTDIASRHILLVGTGKIGSNTCKNLVDYLGTTNITLVNRTPDRAAELACQLGLRAAPMEELPELARSADVIVVATNAIEPVILASHIANTGDKLVIDLSVPYNVELAAQHLANITLINVDDLSKIKDDTLSKRQAEVPRARAIVHSHVAEFLDWCHHRRNVVVLKAVKERLQSMHRCNLFIGNSTHTNALYAVPADNAEKIQRVINNTASKMRQQNQGGCNFIEAINDYMAVANI